MHLSRNRVFTCLLLILTCCHGHADFGNSFGFVTSYPLVFDTFAQEPDVVDPVAICFDEIGRGYVVEMRDYPMGMGPNNEPGGTIRLLEDRDGNGKVDRSTIFATNVSFATSITPWRGGVLVTAPPQIIYFKDNDGDGRSDLREVWFGGFVQGVTDSNVSGLRWGLDNRIHGVNGGNGGKVKSVGQDSRTIDLGNADFSFDPRRRDIALTFQTSGGFGLAFDDWGHSFSTYNINHVQQRVIPLRYANRNRGTPLMELTVSISDHEDMARIFPVSVAETRVNHPEQAGYFSSAGGIHFLSAPGWPGDLSGSLTVADAVGNLIHRDVLRENGAVFQASRAPTELTREFMASTDLACRPMALEAGPDGAIYLLDMQRDVIEHPDYIPAKVKAKLKVRAGEDRGRIYRVHPQNGWRPDSKKLGDSRSSELVEELGSPNAWRRNTAQRLLVEREDKTIVPLVVQRTKAGQPALARLHALWTLEGLGVLTEDPIISALEAKESGLRENAIKLAERRLKTSPGLVRVLEKLSRDSSAFVRLQLSLTLGEVHSKSAEAVLLDIAKKDASDPWIRWAALSSMGGSAVTRLGKLVGDHTWLHTKSHGLMETLELTATVVGARAALTPEEAVELERILKQTPASFLIPILKGLETGQSQSGSAMVLPHAAEVLDHVFAVEDHTALLAAWPLQRRWKTPENKKQRDAMAAAEIRAKDRQLPGSDRQKAIQLLSFGEYEKVASILWNLLGNADAEIQRESVQALRQWRRSEVGKELVSRWSVLQPTLRPLVIQLLLSRREFHDSLLSALENGQLQIGELNLDLEQRRTLLRHSTTEIGRRAAKWMGDEEYSNRMQIVDQWLEKLPAKGIPAEGRTIFEKTCATCHVAGEIGQRVGPDLNSVSHRSIEDLVSNILDPNMAINPAYMTFSAELNSGESEIGLLDLQSGTSVTLLQALNTKITLARSQIKSLKSTGKSLMPEGLESGMTPQDLRHLIAFLQGHP